MDYSKNKKTVVDEELIKSIFKLQNASTNKVTDNKYFDLENAGNFNQEGADKSKMDMQEWFEGLNTSERVLAVSTIFKTNNSEILEKLKEDIKELTNSSFDYESQEYSTRFSNASFLCGNERDAALSGYASVNNCNYNPAGYISRY